MARVTEKRRRPLKNWLVDMIKHDVRKGVYPVGGILEPERKLCEKYGVSRITVKAALESLSREGVISKQPRRGSIVLPSSARRVGTGAREQVGTAILFVRVGNNSWMSDLTQGIEEYCKAAERDSLVLDAQGSHEKLFGYLSAPPKRVGGVILVGYETAAYKRAISDLLRRKIEVVCLERSISGVEASSVVVDNFTGGHLVTTHLLEECGRPVHYIGYSQRTSDVLERTRGWQAAMCERGIDDWKRYFSEIREPEEEISNRPAEQCRIGRELAASLFSAKPEGADGWSVFAMKDFIARGVYQAATEAGLAIGRDVVIAGFGDDPIGRELDPMLTSVHRPRKTLGYIGAELLDHRMADPGRPAVHRILPVRLVKRESSVDLRPRRED